MQNFWLYAISYDIVVPILFNCVIFFCVCRIQTKFLNSDFWFTCKWKVQIFIKASSQELFIDEVTVKPCFMNVSSCLKLLQTVSVFSLVHVTRTYTLFKHLQSNTSHFYFLYLPLCPPTSDRLSEVQLNMTEFSKFQKILSDGLSGGQRSLWPMYEQTSMFPSLCYNLSKALFTCATLRCNNGWSVRAKGVLLPTRPHLGQIKWSKETVCLSIYFKSVFGLQTRCSRPVALKKVLKRNPFCENEASDSIAQPSNQSGGSPK